MAITLNGTTGITNVDGTAAAPAITGTDTDSGMYYPAANQVAIATSGTQAMLANASQGVQFANAIGVGATTPTTSGAGITFPATQSASSNANTLDDYEEGTFTPALVATGYTFTYPQQQGAYTKVGNLVTFKIYISVSYSSGSGTVAASISGLPFTSSASGTNFGGCSFYPDNGCQFFSRTGAIRTNPSATTLSIANGFGGSSVQTTFNWATMGSSLEFELSGHYYV